MSKKSQMRQNFSLATRVYHPGMEQGIFSKTDEYMSNRNVSVRAGGPSEILLKFINETC